MRIKVKVANIEVEIDEQVDTTMIRYEDQSKQVIKLVETTINKCVESYNKILINEGKKN